MSEATKPKRGSMHEARKRRIWLREGGICWICKKPVEMLGSTVRYDHIGTLWITQSDADETIFPIHRKGCDEQKTPKDQRRIAKTKRQSRKLGVDAPEERPPSTLRSGGKLPGKGSGPKLQGRGFQKGGPKRALRSRGF